MGHEVGPRPLAIDTAIFIYFIEKNPRFLPLIDPLFREADDGTRELVTSALTLLEVLVVPLRARNRSLADRYEALLTRSRGIRVRSICGTGQVTPGYVAVPRADKDFEPPVVP